MTSKGATWNKKTSRWQARITTKEGDKRISLGYFETEEAAGQAYDFAVEWLKLGKKLNFPGQKVPASIVREVRPKLVDFFANKKAANRLEKGIEKLDPRFAWYGRQNGRGWANDRWAQGHKPVEIPENIDTNDLQLVMSDIGALGKFFSAITVKELRLDSDAKELAWMTGFLQGAQDLWDEKAADSPAPPAAINLDEFKGDMRRLAENFGSPRPAAAAVPFQVSQPIYSEHCNPETLARDNAAIKKAMAEKTGLFGMIARQDQLVAEGHTYDEANSIMAREDREARENQEKALAEIDGLLSGIL
jgi:hypothetical protein